MKKIFSILIISLLVISLPGCGDKKEKKKSVDELINLYVKGYQNADVDTLVKVFPDFMESSIKNSTTEKEIKNILSYYGKDVKLSINITDKIKMDQKWLDKTNKEIKKDYKTNTKASECYELIGTSEINGSKNSISNEIKDVWYCNFDSKWRLYVK